MAAKPFAFGEQSEPFTQIDSRDSAEPRSASEAAMRSTAHAVSVRRRMSLTEIDSNDISAQIASEHPT